MNFEEILTIGLLIVVTYFMDKFFFYREERRQCELHGGVCEECNCWSCKKKEIELKKEELRKRSEKYERDKKSNKFDKNRKIQKKELER